MSVFNTMLLLINILLSVVGIRANQQCSQIQSVGSLIQSIESCANAVTNSRLSSVLQDERCISEEMYKQQIENVSATLDSITKDQENTSLSLLKIEEDIANNLNVSNHIADTVDKSYNLLNEGNNVVLHVWYRNNTQA